MDNGEVDRMLSYPFLETIAFFSVTILTLIVFLSVFEFVTTYNNWEEIKRGNVAVALATGGKIFGICNIFRFAIAHNDSVYHALVWGIFGFILLLVAYFLFEFLTPAFKIDQEIKGDNRAVGFISFTISVALSYVIGASVI
ncbi:MAG TPA: DUF350 domain-containing protein [Bacilli bacterium]